MFIWKSFPFLDLTHYTSIHHFQIFSFCGKIPFVSRWLRYLRLAFPIISKRRLAFGSLYSCQYFLDIYSVTGNIPVDNIAVMPRHCSGFVWLEKNAPCCKVPTTLRSPPISPSALSMITGKMCIYVKLSVPVDNTAVMSRPCFYKCVF